MQQVQWVLVVFYGKTAHRATYGRLTNEPKYSKDYIQLSRKPEFFESIQTVFPALARGAHALPIEYKWPDGTADGTIFSRSADRPHLAWETNRAPAPWKMAPFPTPTTAETIPGNPNFETSARADNEHDLLGSAGVGQPYLIAVKLVGDENSLHLRVHIAEPSDQFEWADLRKAPNLVRELAATTSKNSALAWHLFKGSDEQPAIYFDPSQKANPWRAENSIASAGKAPEASAAEKTPSIDRDSLAEGLEASEEEVEKFENSIEAGDYEVPDKKGTSNTRGSAQQAFSKKVKDNYGWKCALTGIRSKEFLIASHIVPWSVDKKIRLDPSNGICLSVLADRAFENGYVRIHDDLKVHVDFEKIGADKALRELLLQFDGSYLEKPTKHEPKAEYLRRRREL
ncbi:HNH endonuclease signature motif containing protein [Aliiroseovarius sp. KMU-50]|uniref:HNH endonuclease signature motif containing protein n=1 Tax=Aliiroseovarius salicola TaxID=3009082 RepID=A0ABT4W5C7_9RHOB|nr:HNH endonuclease signature motif containing protein [Aliiroseovarius sp. KMU-50]MDA5095012.1 HNH endonuclease signature motif containing protein [Aliiroseovarius sp. KMU-50]